MQLYVGNLIGRKNKRSVKFHIVNINNICIFFIAYHFKYDTHAILALYLIFHARFTH